MTDAEIIQLIIYCVSTARLQGYKIVNEKADIYWNDKENQWMSNDMTCSCLSAILLIGQRIPELTLKKSDSLFIATLSSLFDKSAQWVESFIDAYNGFANLHSSINGYVLGSNMRKSIPPNQD